MVMALNDFLFEPDEDWRELAACSGADSDLFFAVAEDSPASEKAKAICAACPVQEACLQYAIATNQTDGIWGGMTATDRRRLRRRLRDRERRQAG